MKTYCETYLLTSALKEYEKKVGGEVKLTVGKEDREQHEERLPK